MIRKLFNERLQVHSELPRVLVNSPFTTEGEIHLSVHFSITHTQFEWDSARMKSPARF